jgi:hypothetical protein
MTRVILVCFFLSLLGSWDDLTQSLCVSVLYS